MIIEVVNVDGSSLEGVADLRQTVAYVPTQFIILLVL